MCQYYNAWRRHSVICQRIPWEMRRSHSRRVALIQSCWNCIWSDSQSLRLGEISNRAARKLTATFSPFKLSISFWSVATSRLIFSLDHRLLIPTRWPSKPGFLRRFMALSLANIIHLEGIGLYNLLRGSMKIPDFVDPYSFGLDLHTVQCTVSPREALSYLKQVSSRRLPLLPIRSFLSRILSIVTSFAHEPLR